MLSGALEGGQEVLLTIAGQFPMTSEHVREAAELLQQANVKLLDVLQSVISQSAEVQPAAPAVIG